MPPGRSEFWRVMAARTAVIGIWYAASRSASIQRLIARDSPPTIRTSPTPAERSICTFTTLSATSVSSRSERLPERATVITGEASLSFFAMTGGLTSFGSLARTLATRSRTSWVATSMLRLSTKVTMMMDFPAPEMDLSSVMPSTVFTTSSIFCETCVSTSSVDAPGMSVRTETTGRSTLGKRSTPSLK